MVIEEFTLGARVMSRDGAHLGTIEKLIVHVATERIDGFLLDRGLFAPPTIVETTLVARADAEGVVLTLDAPAAAELPAFFHEQYHQARTVMTDSTALGGQTDAHGPSDGWVVGGPSSSFPQAGGGTSLLRAPVGNVATENVSNVPAEDVLIGAGTDVVDGNGQKIGRVDKVLVDGDGRMTEVVVETGWLVTHELRVPLAAVAGIAHDHIRLGVTSEAATSTAAAELGQ